MLEAVTSALVTALIQFIFKASADNRALRREQLLQVVKYLEHFACVIEGTIAEYRKGSPLHICSAKALELDSGLDVVLKTILDPAAEAKIQEYRQAFRQAINLLVTPDALTPKILGAPWTSSSQQLLTDLGSTAGHFRGVAATLRATA
jgi:hypothetical protein